jgi:putative acetyltransferase
MHRNATSADFEFIYGLYMHPEVNPYLLYEQIDRDTFRPIFLELIESAILYVYEAEGEAVGMFKLIPLKHRTAHVAYVGGVAIHPAFAGKGFGLQMMHEILTLSRSLGIVRVELSATVTNERAIRLYTKAGFVEEGILRKYAYFKSKDLYSDEVLMAYIFET